MTNDTWVVLAPTHLLPEHTTHSSTTVVTPFGTVVVQASIGLLWFSAASPQAYIYAAKEMHIQRIIDIIPVWGVNHLLEPGDIFLPDDMIDLSMGSSMTFFVNKGYGFLPQNPPFCPNLRMALLNGAHHVTAERKPFERPHVFARGIYGAKNNTGIQHTREWIALVEKNIDATGTAGTPTPFLAHELELCYVPVCYVTHRWHTGNNNHHDNSNDDERDERDDHDDCADCADYTAQNATTTLLLHIVAAAQTLQALEQPCTCATTMQPLRERGVVGTDWHTWIG